MRKFIKYTFYSLALTFISCHKEKLEDVPSLLIGKWQAIKYQSMWGIQDIIDPDIKDIIEIKQNGTIFLYNYQMKLLEKGRVSKIQVLEGPKEVYSNPTTYPGLIFVRVSIEIKKCSPFGKTKALKEVREIYFRNGVEGVSPSWESSPWIQFIDANNSYAFDSKLFFKQ